MTFVTKSAVIALFATAIPAAAFAQGGRLTLSFAPAVATASGDSELAVAGTVGYRVTNHFSFEGDVTWIDAAAGGFRNRRFDMDPRVNAGSLNTVLQGLGTMFGGANGRNPLPTMNIGTALANRPGMQTNTMPNVTDRFAASTNGSTWIGTMGARYEPTVQTARFRPYLSAGIGINYTDQKISLARTATMPAVNDSMSRSGMAFSAGGGVTIKLVNALWLGADAKYFRLSRDRDLMRLGGGVTFKF